MGYPTKRKARPMTAFSSIISRIILLVTVVLLCIVKVVFSKDMFTMSQQATNFASLFYKIAT